MTTITKKQIVERIAARTKLTKVMTKETVQLFLDSVTEELARGNRIELRDFGVFEVKDRARRIGRNPRTGEPVPVPERRVVTFKVGRMMRKKVATTNSRDGREGASSGSAARSESGRSEALGG
ncbi:MAG: integration host factor subunit beta [Planctomycetes bacterium]|nr:integration host factor subunit beta [Planctomycetota bacterium]